MKSIIDNIFSSFPVCGNWTKYGKIFASLTTFENCILPDTSKYYWKLKEKRNHNSKYNLLVSFSRWTWQCWRLNQSSADQWISSQENLSSNDQTLSFPWSLSEQSFPAVFSISYLIGINRLRFLVLTCSVTLYKSSELICTLLIRKEKWGSEY